MCPGTVLSQQGYQYKSEHWTMVCGTARVDGDDNVLTPVTSEFVYI